MHMAKRCQIILSPRCFDDMFGQRVKVVEAFMNWGRLIINVEGIGLAGDTVEEALVKEFDSLPQLRNFIGKLTIDGNSGNNHVYNSQSRQRKKRASGPNVVRQER